MNAYVAQTLARLGIVPRKRRGQNFLIDPALVQDIADFAEVSRGEPVLEIGAGLGALTGELVSRTDNLAVVEIEKKFCVFLAENLPGLPRQRIICADVCKLVGSALGELFAAAQFAVVANLPYSISSAVCLWILENRKFITRAALLLQREFAERLAAAPGGRQYGSLSVLRTMYAEAELGTVISGASFYPPAEVDSRLLRLKLRQTPLVAVRDQALFTKIVRASFGQRRKTLLNSLSGAGLLPTKDAVREYLQALGIDPARRAETLSVEEFARMANAEVWRDA